MNKQKRLTAKEAEKLNKAIQTIVAYCERVGCLSCQFRKSDWHPGGHVCKFGSLQPWIWNDMTVQPEVKEDV